VKEQGAVVLPRVIYGTMTIPTQTPVPVAKEMLVKLVAAAEGTGRKAEIDTARMYEKGNTEIALGEILSQDADLASKLTIASKVNPFPGYNNTLSKDSVLKQFKEITESLQRSSVDILYLHAPDPKVPILETLEAIQSIYEAGGFKELGLSNYQSWEVVHIYHLCKQKGWVVPTVYQGMYNFMTREVERELFPALRALNMRFYAYNPLAGGFLSGKHTKESIQSLTEGRFRVENKMYRERYLQDSQFEALEVIKRGCEAAGIPLAEAAIRWVFHHSKLSGAQGDAVIIGASKMDYFDQNLAASTTKCSPLPADIVEAMNESWKIVKKTGTCPSYERGCSKY
jgi:aflatoxin B1 aldehyde reductase